MAIFKLTELEWIITNAVNAPEFSWTEGPNTYTAPASGYEGVVQIQGEATPFNACSGTGEGQLGGAKNTAWFGQG